METFSVASSGFKVTEIKSSVVPTPVVPLSVSTKVSNGVSRRNDASVMVSKESVADVEEDSIATIGLAIVVMLYFESLPSRVANLVQSISRLKSAPVNAVMSLRL